MTTFIVAGSHGTLEVDSVTGEVIKNTPLCGPDCDYCKGNGYGNIARFDLSEWHAAYPERELKAETVDILDLGYWMKDDFKYESPDGGWRDMITAFRKEVKHG